MSASMPKYLSASDVETILGVSRRRVNQLIERHQLTAIRIGNSNAVEPESLREYLETGRRYKTKPKKSNGSTNGHK